jgi:hypothetical protein
MDRYYRWSAWTIVSIDSIRIDPSIHRLLCPAMVGDIYPLSQASLGSCGGITYLTVIVPGSTVCSRPLDIAALQGVPDVSAGLLSQRSLRSFLLLLPLQDASAMLGGLRAHLASSLWCPRWVRRVEAKPLPNVVFAFIFCMSAVKLN